MRTYFASNVAKAENIMYLVGLTNTPPPRSKYDIIGLIGNIMTF